MPAVLPFSPTPWEAACVTIANSNPGVVVEENSKPSFNRAFNAVLERPENKRLIVAPIEELAEQTLACRAAFEKISRLLLSFDRKGYRNKNGGAISLLCPSWDLLSREYDALLRKSRHDATILKVVCDDYVKNIVGILNTENVSVEDVKIKLREFIKRTEKSERKAQFFALHFTDLRSRVESQRKVIENSFQTADADPDDRIPGLELSIEELRDEIDNRQQFIKNWLRAAEIGEKLAAVGLLLMNWCPPLAALAMAGLITMGVSDLIAYKAKQRIEDIRSNLQTREEELAQLQAGKGALKELRHQLVASAGAFQTIATQLAALSDFWESVKSDCQALIEHLNKVETVEMITQYGLKAALSDSFSGSVYAILGQTLAVYVSRVTKLS